MSERIDQSRRGVLSVLALETAFAQFGTTNSSNGQPQLPDGSTAKINQYVQRVTLYTDLQAISLEDAARTTTASVMGRTVIGFGFGLFDWISGDQSANVAADPQKGIWIPPAADLTGARGAWKRRYSGDIDIRWFGAKGDGKTEDSSAIQAAANYGRSIYIPTGDYLVSTEILVNRRQSWRGDGPFQSRIRNNTTSGSQALRFTEADTPDQFPALRYSSFRDFGVIGGLPSTGLLGDNPNCGDGIKLDNASWMLWENIALYGNKNGVTIGNSCIAHRWFRCIIKANRAYGVNDIAKKSNALEAVDFALDQCNVEQNLIGVVSNSSHFTICGGTYEANTNEEIILNKVGTVMGAYLETASAGTIDTPRTMLRMTPAAYGSKLIGNKFITNNAAYVHIIDYANHLTCTGNTFFNMAKSTRSVNYSGTGVTASVFTGNIDMRNPNWKGDKPMILGQATLIFPNDGPPSTGITTNNNLQWFEEGSFTPKAIGRATVGAGTYTDQSGHYSRIGNRVFFDMHLHWNTHTGRGALQLTGLPFASANVTPLTIFTVSLPQRTGRQITAYVEQAANTIALIAVDPSTGASIDVVIDSEATILHIAGNYQVMTTLSTLPRLE